MNSNVVVAIQHTSQNIKAVNFFLGCSNCVAFTICVPAYASHSFLISE